MAFSRRASEGSSERDIKVGDWVHTGLVGKPVSWRRRLMSIYDLHESGYMVKRISGSDARGLYGRNTDLPLLFFPRYF